MRFLEIWKDILITMVVVSMPPLQPYSEDVSAAGQVLERIKQLNLEVIPFDNGLGKFEDVNHMTPEAICKAALLAMSEVKGE